MLTAANPPWLGGEEFEGMQRHNRGIPRFHRPTGERPGPPTNLPGDSSERLRKWPSVTIRRVTWPYLAHLMVQEARLTLFQLQGLTKTLTDDIHVH